MDRPRWSDGPAGQMDGKARWWTTSGNFFFTFFISTGKQTFYVICDTFVGFIRPASPAALNISVEITSDPGVFFVGFPFSVNSTSVLVIVRTYVWHNPLLSSSYSSPIHSCHLARILSFSITMFPSLSSLQVVLLHFTFSSNFLI